MQLNFYTGLMAPPAISFAGSFSNSLTSHFSRNLSRETTSKSLKKLRKVIDVNFGRLNFPTFSNAAICHSFDESSAEELGGNVAEGVPREDGLDFSHLVEEDCVRPDHYTYAWLLKGCLSSCSLMNAKGLHCRILKSGFHEESILCAHLVKIYSVYGDPGDAIMLFDNMSRRSLSFCNNIISGFLDNGSNKQVLAFFSQMLAHQVNPDHTTFASVFRACKAGNVALNYIEQVHAKIIFHGIATDPVVCNPLIDLYSKNCYIESAQLMFEELCSRDSISWVAMISGFSQNGHEEEAVLLFCQMRKAGIFPTPYVFSSVISACTKIQFFDQGKQLHAQVVKLGFSSETFVCNALITLYSRHGSLTASEQIFVKMNHRDGVTYNSLISGLAQCGNSERAVQLFEEMQHSDLKPDCVTVASLLSACASVGAFYKGSQLHSYAIKVGISSDIIIEGSLLDLYVKCSDIVTAREFFNTVQRTNIVLWNMMLVAYGQLGCLRGSLEIFSQMQFLGMVPNQYTYPSILRTCTSLGAIELGEQIHTHIIKTGFELNVYVCSVLIDMYAKHGWLEIAHEILERLPVEDVVSWTALIAGYAQHNLCIEALKLFEDMQNKGIRPDNIGLSSVLSACTEIQAFNQGRQIHAQSCVSGYSDDLSVGNALVNFYARCGRVQDACLAFKMIDSKDEISWNGLISGFSQSGHYEEALQVFAWMNQTGLVANSFTYGSVVSASANMADINQGMQMHARMIKTGHCFETEAGNVLITLYAKCGSINHARRMFDETPEKNEVSWNAMITGYSQHGYGFEALDLFEGMKLQGSVPNHVTFVGILSACSHVGLVSEGLTYFKSMSKEYAIDPRPEHYACVVDILGRAGLLDSAREFIEEMTIVPDAMIWRTLLSACAIHKNAAIGEFAAQHLMELEPEDSATYVLLSNMYAVTRKWDQRDQIRRVMKDRGVKKEPGRSWIEVKNSIHAFFVGDQLHPLADKIYDSLKDLNRRVAEIGYVQDRYSLLHESEQEQKDPTVLIHSEKLAVAFGLISLSPAIPIRVIKNLRVCNDCHNWMKFVSKVSNRAVIVRDAYRFHHFEDGGCSCRDYW